MYFYRVINYSMYFYRVFDQVLWMLVLTIIHAGMAEYAFQPIRDLFAIVLGLISKDCSAKRVSLE